MVEMLVTFGHTYSILHVHMYTHMYVYWWYVYMYVVHDMYLVYTGSL